MEVDSHAVSAGEKADGRRATTGADQRCPRFGSTVKRRPGRRAALVPVRRLLARAVVHGAYFVHGFEAKMLAYNTVAIAAGPFWLGCPGPPVWTS